MQLFAPTGRAAEPAFRTPDSSPSRVRDGAGGRVTGASTVIDWANRKSLQAADSMAGSYLLAIGYTDDQQGESQSAERPFSLTVEVIGEANEGPDYVRAEPSVEPTTAAAPSPSQAPTGTEPPADTPQPNAAPTGSPARGWLIAGATGALALFSAIGIVAWRTLRRT